MSTYDFMVTAKKAVWGWYQNHNRKPPAGWQDVFVVWECKALQNQKVCLATPMRDGLYFEVTLNGDKGEIYLDVYEKIDNQKIVLPD